MDKEKSPISNGAGGGNAGCLPSQPSRYALFASPLDSYGFTNNPSVSSSSQSPDSGQFGHPTPSDAGRFSYDVSRMPDCPPKNSGHRRAHSEILSLPDDLNFGSDLGVVMLHDGPSLSDEPEEDLISMFVDAENFSSCATSAGLSICEVSPVPDVPSGSSERPRMRHQHSQSLDGSTAIKPEFLMSGGEGSSSMETKKAMSAAKLAELTLVDPRRAKRILANRQSAARSKERKMRYISELERKVQTLQSEATTLSAQLNVLQTDTNGLTVENNELKLQWQTMEQQVHLQDALNETLRKEIQWLKMATGQMLPSGGQTNFAPPFGANQQYYHHNPAIQSLLAAHQLQQLQIRSQHPQQLQPHRTQVQQQLRNQRQPKQQQLQPPAELTMKGPSLPLQNQFDEAPFDNRNAHE